MREEGFLSPKLDRFKSALIDAHPDWFDLARRFNTLAMRVWLDHPVTREGLQVNTKEPLVIRLFARAISGYEGAIMLLERGMTVEAGTLIRSIYETGFWIGYILNHEIAALKFFNLDELRGKEGRFRAFEKLFSTDPVKVAQIRNTLVKTRAQLRDQPKSPSMESIATMGGVGNHYANYKVLCGSSAHASMSSTGHYLELYDDDTVGHVIGPDIDGTGRMTAFAIHSLIVAFIGFVQTIENDDVGPELFSLSSEYFRRAEGMGADTELG